MQRTFTVSGYRPVDRRVNQFIQACDLGTDGMFYRFSEEVTLTVNDAATPEQLAQHPDALRQAYEAVGCRNVVVSFSA